MSKILDQSTVAAGNVYLPLLCSISTKLSTYDAADISNTNDTAIIFTSNLSVFSSNLSTAVLTQLLAAVSGKLFAPTTSNTTTEFTSKQNSKTKINTAKLEIIDGSSSTDLQFHGTTIRISTTKFGHQNYLSLLVISEDASPNNLETNQKQSFTNNIPPATVTNDELLAAIFLFELEKNTPVPLFSGATFDTKPITTMYTDAKVNKHSIKLILDSESAGSIITKQLMDQLATKTPIGKIDDFSIKVNGIIVSIKVLPEWMTHTSPLIEFEKEKKKPTWEAYQVSWTGEEHNKLPPDKLSTTWEWEEDKIKKKGKKKEENSIPTPIHSTYMYTTPQSSYHYPKLICIDCSKKLSSMGTCCGNNKEYSTDNEPCLACGETFLNEEIWNNIPGQRGTCNESSIKCLNRCPHDNKIWQMALAKIEGATPEEIKTIKDNPSEPIELDWDSEPVINLLDLKQFYEHYQKLAPTKEEQEQYCALESESVPNPNSDSNNDNNKNNSFSSIQNGNNNDNNSNSDSNSDSNYEQYIVLPNLTKKQELKWFSDNNEDIMPEHAHNINTGFDLKYLKKDPIKLEPHLCTCIDLKIALEIPATIMVQLASRNSLAKKKLALEEE
ncbi:hypothetical protein G9A89_016235 [Geosiphon pyriformis]|nr:hypothetical protein G9A89_016235 [Geosiphon pyriformis]